VLEIIVLDYLFFATFRYDTACSSHDFQNSVGVGENFGSLEFYLKLPNFMDNYVLNKIVLCLCSLYVIKIYHHIILYKNTLLGFFCILCKEMG
jgi:hypothetical protein